MHESPSPSGQVAVESKRDPLAQAVNVTKEKLPPSILGFLRRLSESYTEMGFRDRAPMAILLLSVVFQEYLSWGPVKSFVFGQFYLDVLAATIILAAALSLSARTSRLAVGIFLVVASIAIIPDWRGLANHVYLGLWTIPVAVLFREWWKSDLYAFYLRMTLAIVMFAAFSQKILAGTYVDGTYLAFLGAHGGTTERMFSFLCDSASSDPCSYYQFISIFILAWQLMVGLLLLLGLNSIIFLVIEIGFLLGAGVYADEMNFQILNIALLCIVFRFGMPLWLAVFSVAMLFLDAYGVSRVFDLVVSYAA